MIAEEKKNTEVKYMQIKKKKKTWRKLHELIQYFCFDRSDPELGRSDRLVWYTWLPTDYGYSPLLGLRTLHYLLWYHLLPSGINCLPFFSTELMLLPMLSKALTTVDLASNNFIMHDAFLYTCFNIMHS